MKKSIIEMILGFIRQIKRNRRWRNTVTCIAALVVFVTTYLMILPAITLEGAHPRLSAETVTGWAGDPMSVTVKAESPAGSGEKVVVITAEAVDAGLSEEYVFDSDEVTVIRDSMDQEILLHRTVREGEEGKEDRFEYWFALSAGQQTEFTLNLQDEIDVKEIMTSAGIVKNVRIDKDAEKASASDADKEETIAAAENEATASDAVKETEAAEATASSASKATPGSAEEDVDDDGKLADGMIVNDLETPDEDAGTEVTATLKLMVGMGNDFEEAVRDVERNAEKRGDASLEYRWRIALNIEKELSWEADGVSVTMFYNNDARIPEDARLFVAEIPQGSAEYNAYLESAKSAMGVDAATASNAASGMDEAQKLDVNYARFFDIRILDADGDEIEPEAQVIVKIDYDEAESITGDTDVQMVHFPKAGGTELVDAIIDGEDKELNGVAFNAGGFSVYGIVGTETITTNYITAEGDTYEVTVTYGRDAEIPDKSTLSVAEVTEAAADYESYKKQTADALNGVTDNFQYIKLLDISIINANGEKVIPAAAVDVNIRLLDKSEVSENTQIVHFGEKVEVLESSVEDDAVTFSTEGFSVFVIVDISDLPENNITQTFENDKFIITASYTEKAKIPEDAVLKVSEISYESDPDHYVDRVDQLSGLFSESQYVCKELLNIGFWSNETNTSELLVNGSDSTEIEPADTVLIAIQFKDTAKYSEGDALSIIHFGKEGPEIAVKSVLDEENALNFEVGSFSDFAVVGEIEYISPISDTAEIHKEGSVTGFLSNLPYGTIYVDYNLMDFSKYSFATSGSSVTGTSTNNPDVSVSIEIKSSNYTAGRGTNGRYGICYSQPTLAAGETVKTEGTFAIITYKNVATLSTGEKANVIVTLSDGYIENTNPNVSQNIGNPVYYGNGLLPSAMSNGFRTAGQFTINIKVTANENDSISGKTFLFGINDYDIGSVVYIKDTYALSSLNGELIGIKIKDGGGSADISGFGRITFPENGVGTYQHASGESHNIRRFFSIPVENEEVIPLYEEDGTTPVLENGEQATAKYKTACYDNTTGEFLFWLLTQDEVISEQTEILNGRLSKIYVSDESTLFVENTSNGAVRLSGTRGTGGSETTQEDYDDMMRSGYFVVADAENGLTFRARCSAGANTHLTNSNMIYRIYSRTYEGGTISTSDTDVWGNQTAYGVHQPEGATGYKQALLAVPKNKTAVYTMTPDTFWHIWKVKISDGTEANTSGEIDLRNVTWTDGSYTYHGANGTDYTFTKDSNGIISYTFTGVSEDHYITVWWEKDPPQQTVTIIKKWYDEGNARLSRPDDGSTQWVKNDTANQWEYTFAVATLPEGVSFKAYEDQVSDYIGDAVGNQNANTATEIGFNEDTNTHQYEVVITNTRKNGTLSFSKTDQYGFPVEGASFRLYNDADCTQPPAAVYTATSDSTGTVTFSDVPCGMYYMKETNIPTYGEGSKPYTDNRRQVYQVVIHENSEDSTITPGTVANHVFTPSDNPVSAIINTKPEGQVTITKIVDGDATVQAQRFVFVMEFPANMAEKTIKINGSDATLGTAVEGKVLYEFTLSHNGSITFSALPDDMSYKVEEHEKVEFRTSVSIDPQPSAGTFIIGEEGNDAYVSGKIDADQDYTISYTNKKLNEDENFIIVEKTFEGITADQIPEDFSVTVTGQGATYTLTKGLNTENIKFSTSEDGLTWKWTIYGAEAGTYTISETNEEVADYVVTTDPAGAASQSGHSAQTVAPDFSVTGSERINSCNNKTFDVEDNFIFIASLTGQGNSGVIVVSQYALSAAQRNAIKDWAQVHGRTINFLDYRFFSTEQQGNEFHVGNATVTYDSQAKTVTFKGTNNWQHVLKGTISKIPGENPDIKITNTYTKKTKEIVITKTDENGNELTGAVFTLIKDSQQVDGSLTDPAVSSTTFNLEYGIYCLTETTAPNGYVILSNKIYFKVDDNGITLQTVSVGNDGKTTYSDANEEDYPLVSLSEDALIVYVKNIPGTELPNTGGSGTLPYTLGGLILMIISASMYGFRMRRRERRLDN